MFGHKSFLRIGAFSDRSIIGMQKEGYELASFTHHFHQEIDQNGKVLSGVRGGTITVLIEGFPSQELIDWGMDSRIYHWGEVVVVDTDGNILEKIQFELGACTFFKIHYVSTGNAYCITKLMIEAKKIKAGDDVELERNWTIDFETKYRYKL